MPTKQDIQDVLTKRGRAKEAPTSTTPLLLLTDKAERAARGRPFPLSSYRSGVAEKRIRVPARER